MPKKKESSEGAKRGEWWKFFYYDGTMYGSDRSHQAVLCKGCTHHALDEWIRCSSALLEQPVVIPEDEKDVIAFGELVDLHCCNEIIWNVSTPSYQRTQEPAGAHAGTC